MKKYVSMYVLLLLITSCKTTAPMVPLVVKDSVSVTYRQGEEHPLAICVIDESLPAITTGGKDFRHCSERTSTQSAGEKIPRNWRNSDKGASGRLNIRVDTVIIERWHTREVCSPPSPTEQTSDIKHQTFYKNCTKGFWILLILLLGTTAFRIFKAIYLRK